VQSSPAKGCLTPPPSCKKTSGATALSALAGSEAGGIYTDHLAKCSVQSVTVPRM
jgi:hypothetical protein